MSFANQALKNVPKDWNTQLLEAFQAVTKEDVLASLEKYFLPLFNPATSVAAVVTAPGKADEIVSSLTSEGFEVERRTLEVDPDELMGAASDSESDDSGMETESSSDDGRK